MVSVKQYLLLKTTHKHTHTHTPHIYRHTHTYTHTHKHTQRVGSTLWTRERPVAEISDYTIHSQEADIRAPGKIRTRSLNKRTAASSCAATGIDRHWQIRRNSSPCINPLKPELNPICFLLALLGAHHFLHVSRIRVKSLTLRWLMSCIYGAPILDVSRSHTTTQHSR